MAQTKIVTGSHDVADGTFRSYTTGFVTSVVLTAIAFALVMSHAVTGSTAIAAIIGLALVQLFVQVKFFLHLGSGSSRRWNILVFGFMLIIVVILVAGSLWIMHNLSYHHDARTPQQIDRDITKDENITR